MSIGTRNLRAPRGAAIPRNGWPQDAALRMPVNSLDPEAAGRPDELIVFRDHEDRGLTMYGQTTTGSWIDIGAQRINRATTYAAAAARHFGVPDVLSDQRSAHDAPNSCVPRGMSLAEAPALRHRSPDESTTRAMRWMARRVKAMHALRERGALRSTIAITCPCQAQRAGVQNAFDIRGFVPEHVRPPLCEGKKLFGWVALSGDPDGITMNDTAAREIFAGNEALTRWIDMAITCPRRRSPQRARARRPHHGPIVIGRIPMRDGNRSPPLETIH